MTDMIYTPSDERPKGIAALAVLQILGGVMTVGVVVLGSGGISESLSGTGLSWTSLSAATVVYGALGIAAGIGMWRGKAWGWWLAAFTYVHGIVRNVGMHAGGGDWVEAVRLRQRSGGRGLHGGDETRAGQDRPRGSQADGTGVEPVEDGHDPAGQYERGGDRQ